MFLVQSLWFQVQEFYFYFAIIGQFKNTPFDQKSQWHLSVGVYMHNSLDGEKSRIRDTKHLSNNADSSTDAIGGWTKNTQKPDFVEKQKNHPKRKNSKTSRNMPKFAIRPSNRFFF